MDLKIRDEEGKEWDYTKPHIWRKAKELLEKDQPTLVIGSPTCTNVSCIMNLNWSRITPEAKEQRINEARIHFNFRLEMHRTQHEAGRCLPQEHPLSATPWREPGAMNLAGVQGVIETKAHMCRFGMTQVIDDRVKSVKEPTGF